MSRLQQPARVNTADYTRAKHKNTQRSTFSPMRDARSVNHIEPQHHDPPPPDPQHDHVAMHCCRGVMQITRRRTRSTILTEVGAQ